MALLLEIVEPGAHSPEALGVPGRPDRHRGLLHRVAEMAIPVDQRHQRAPLRGLVALGGRELLAGATQEVFLPPLYLWPHRAGFALGPDANGQASEHALRRPRTDGGWIRRHAGLIDGGREDPHQAAQANRRQVTPTDHRANGLLVTSESPGRIGDGEQERIQVDGG
jgi:hypothetical protein